MRLRSIASWLAAASLGVLVLAGCVPFTSGSQGGSVKPSEHDVMESFNWLIGTIDGTMRATGRSKWVYKRGFQSKACPVPGGGDGFQFSWVAYMDVAPDPVLASHQAADYFASLGMKGAKTGDFKGFIFATYRNDQTRVFAQYLDGGKGATFELSTPCKPGNATEAEKILNDLTDRGKVHDPKFFDPNA